MKAKAKAVFIGTQVKYDNAYNAEIQQKIQDDLDMLGVYEPEMLRDPKADLTPLKEVEYVFTSWGMANLNEEEIRRILPNLKAIFYAAGTVQYFARPFLNCGVKIFSAWAVNAIAVAEVAAAEVILANKGFYQTMHQTGEAWTEHDNGKPYVGNFHTAVGIIGAGMIGSQVIRILKNYDLDLFVFDPYMSEERAEKLGVTKVEKLPDLFAKCNVITNHLANKPETERLINEECFENMGEKSVFINTARGITVVEEAMIQAMKEKPTRAAVLDVTWPEPPVPGSELYTLPNIILTPHMAGSIGNEVQRMGNLMWEEYSAFSKGEPTRYGVTEDMLKTMA